ncbi:MAG: anion permease [Firmicutes bacterium]|nr:anion permease [Bacillota bacterium]
MENVKKFFKSQPVLCVAFVLACITCIFVPPGLFYVEYINTNVIIQLYALMVAVAGLSGSGLFKLLAEKIGNISGSLRGLGFMLMFATLVLSMFITNDVALITIVPFTCLLLSELEDEKPKILIIVAETVAANIGSMVTPVGNPQNIYLFNTYKMDTMKFVQVLLPSAVVAVVLLVIILFFLPSKKPHIPKGEGKITKKINIPAFSAVFAIGLLCVLRFVDAWICLLFATAIALIFDRKVLKNIDWSLLATFICFFIFVGNLANIKAINELISMTVQGREFIFSLFLSQFISNVPTAVMLSNFTDKGYEILLGTDIGGLGTPIASLASLIALQAYRKSKGADTLKFLKVFSIVNFGILFVLVILNGV